MRQWPDLDTWSLPQLLRLKASWSAITPMTAEEHDAHTASLAELDAVLARTLAALATQQPPEEEMH
jgi:hypothetical protein